MRSALCACATVALIAGCTAGSESDQTTDESAASQSPDRWASAGSSDETARPGRPPAHPRGVILDCSMQSWANFGQAFTDPNNLVVGPLIFVGGNETSSAATVEAYGGQKYPLLVKVGHTVTVQLPRHVRHTAGLAYGPLPEGQVQVDDAHDTITSEACPKGESNPGRAGGPVTFWSGFVMTRSPDCIPLDVYVDHESSPRHAAIPVGPHPCESTSRDHAGRST
jgi:hypothetical protein